MTADFLDAHHRHRQDAQHLFEKKYWANADHLFGMAAECGLKRLMLAFGMRFDSDKNRPSDVADCKHADGIWARFESYRRGHAQGVKYDLGRGINPFHNWKAEQRYAHQSEFDKARVDEHREASEIIHNLINQARREGLV